MILISQNLISGVGELDALFKSTITNNAEIKEENTMSAADFQKKLMKHKIPADTQIMSKVQAISWEIKKANMQSSGDYQRIQEKKKEQLKNDFYANIYENSENPLNNQILNDQTEYKQALKSGLRNDPHNQVKDTKWTKFIS